MSVEEFELTTGNTSFSAALQLPDGETDHGAVLIPGANHTAFDDAVFDRLATKAADNGIAFLRYQTWTDGDELAVKSEDELHSEVDTALEHLRERGCSRITLVGKSAGGAVALRYAPPQADEMVLWAPALFLDGGDVVADLDIPDEAQPPTIGATELSELDVPVDILQGDQDDFPVANARELAAEIAEGTVHVIEGADHSFIGGDPETETIETTVAILSQPVDER